MEKRLVYNVEWVGECIEMFVFFLTFLFVVVSAFDEGCVELARFRFGEAVFLCGDDIDCVRYAQDDLVDDVLLCYADARFPDDDFLFLGS